MSMPTMIVASDVPPQLVERFSRESSNVVPPAVAGTPAEDHTQFLASPTMSLILRSPT